MILPLLALVATLLLPIARPVHEAIEASIAVSMDHHPHGELAEHDHEPGETHSHQHDSQHCTVCAAIVSLKQVTAHAAFLFALSHEPAPRFVLPTYLAPTTAEPALAIVIPRGPPASL